MRILLLQIDSEFPNLALMRISAHHKALGHTVRLKVAGNWDGIARSGPEDYDRIYCSLIFKRSRPLAERIKLNFPGAVMGGSGWDVIPEAVSGLNLISIGERRRSSSVSTVEARGITTKSKDYSLYPRFEPSIGFTQRGCRMNCGFCDVPVKEGKVWADDLIHSIWRGDPHPRQLILWDNDTFGNPDWRSVFRSIRDGGFKVSFNQGINARLMDEENAEALAGLDCYDARFKTRRWYTAWDNRNDERILFRGLHWLVKYGVRPDQIMVYMLCGYWPGETHADREYRRSRLRAFGARPYPMPFVRTPELVGFQRWVIGAYDKRVPWTEWKAAGYRPEKLGVGFIRPLIQSKDKENRFVCSA